MTRHYSHWTKEENALLTELWASDLKMDLIAGYFPHRAHYTVYEHARRVLGLPARRISQKWDDILSWQLVSAHLQRKPATARQIADATGLKASTVTCLLNGRRGRLVYIHEYARQETRCVPVRVWALGAEKDARRPKVLTDTERKRKYMKRLRKEEPERIEVWTEKKRVRRQLESGALQRRDESAAWF